MDNIFALRPAKSPVLNALPASTTDEAACLRVAGTLAIAFADWHHCVSAGVVPPNEHLLAEGKRLIAQLTAYRPGSNRAEEAANQEQIQQMNEQIQHLYEEMQAVVKLVRRPHA